MATFNNTRYHVKVRKSRFNENIINSRIPLPNENESFYFNQDATKATVTISHQTSKISNFISVHLTNQRLILLSQGNLQESEFESFEVYLNELKSLKSKLAYHKKLRLHAVLTHDTTLDIHIKFDSKIDRRESLIEYLKMAISAIVSVNKPRILLSQQEDVLPSYLEATQPILLPPAYH